MVLHTEADSSSVNVEVKQRELHVWLDVVFLRRGHRLFLDVIVADVWNVMMLGVQVQSVVLAEYFPHKGDSTVYIELSGNIIKSCLSLSSSSNPPK
jgi:hypothetical protein